jgi:hypothetical protein
MLAITALFVVGGFMALGFLQKTSQEHWALFVLFSSLGMIGSLALLMFVGVFWRRMRKWTWQRAMASWQRASLAGTLPKFVLEKNIVEAELRQLALQVFSWMGYRLASGLGEGAYLTLINPDGRIEVVGYKQPPEQAELHHIYSLELEMKRTKAVRGFCWAPAGFAREATKWVGNRPIVLADEVEIGRMVDCARAKGSRLLEP